MPSDDGGAEGGQIGVQLVVLADDHIGGVARGLRTAVHVKVLGSGDDAVVARVVALHAGHKGHAHARGQERIFAVGLLAAAPAGIAEEVEVGRPEVEALEDVGVAAAAHGLGILDARLGADGFGHLVDGGRIEGCRQGDWLGELGRPFGQHTVQRLIPPVIGRNIEARNGARLIDQLAGFLFERQPFHQIRGSLLGGQAGVQIGGLGGILRPGHPGRRSQHQRCRCPAQSKAHH